MTDTEAKALALVNGIAVERGGSPVDFYGLEGDIIATALCRAIEREAATEARHAEELREQAERFSEVAKAVLHQMRSNQLMQAHVSPLLTPFIIAKPDPLVEAIKACEYATLDAIEPEFAKSLRAALAARGGKIVWGDDQ